MRQPKAILFDLDDTLISFDGVSEAAWEKCCRDFVQKHAVPYSADKILEELHKTRKFFWDDHERHKAGRLNLKNARREIVKSTLQLFDISDDALICELADNYGTYRTSLICLYPNTIETLAGMRAAGYRLGMITNGASEEQRAKIDRFSLEPYFEVILVEHEVGYGKPDIRVYELALKLLGLLPQDVWMVGDNLVWDIQAPQTLGIYTVWYDQKKSGLPAHTPIVPDKQIRDISELLQDLC